MFFGGGESGGVWWVQNWLVNSVGTPTSSEDHICLIKMNPLGKATSSLTQDLKMSSFFLISDFRTILSDCF